MFVDTSRIAVTADGVIEHEAITPEMNIIFIRKKMDFGTQQRVQSSAIKISATNGKGDADFDVGAYTVALAVHNILDWQGPAFAGVACTPKNIERLDPADPLFVQVMNEIGTRNPRVTNDPKSSTPVGKTNGVVNA